MIVTCPLIKALVIPLGNISVFVPPFMDGCERITLEIVPDGSIFTIDLTLTLPNANIEFIELGLIIIEDCIVWFWLFTGLNNPLGNMLELPSLNVGVPIARTDEMLTGLLINCAG